jgi:hypothetical protein
MHFDVAGVRYRVRIIPNLADDEGPMNGYCDNHYCELLISGNVHPSQRKRVLNHELYHAWTERMPEPDEPEKKARWHETVTTSNADQLEAQGGDDALEQLPIERSADESRTVVPIDDAGFEVELSPRASSDLLTIESPRTVHRAEHSAYAREETSSCPVCDARQAGGAIVTGAAMLDAQVMGWCVTRTAYCDHCDVLYRWKHLSDRYGTPIENAVATSPTIIRGEQVRLFLQEHPVAIGSYE